MALCASSYPSVLAFSFLNELMKEFVTIYDQSKVENVVRPYSFMQFGEYRFRAGSLFRQQWFVIVLPNHTLQITSSIKRVKGTTNLKV